MSTFYDSAETIEATCSIMDDETSWRERFISLQQVHNDYVVSSVAEKKMSYAKIQSLEDTVNVLQQRYADLDSLVRERFTTSGTKMAANNASDFGPSPAHSERLADVPPTPTAEVVTPAGCPLPVLDASSSADCHLPADDVTPAVDCSLFAADVIDPEDFRHSATTSSPPIADALCLPTNPPVCLPSGDLPSTDLVSSSDVLTNFSDSALPCTRADVTDEPSDSFNSMEWTVVTARKRKLLRCTSPLGSDQVCGRPPAKVLASNTHANLVSDRLSSSDPIPIINVNTSLTSLPSETDCITADAIVPDPPLNSTLNLNLLLPRKAVNHKKKQKIDNVPSLANANNTPVNTNTVNTSNCSGNDLSNSGNSLSSSDNATVNTNSNSHISPVVGSCSVNNSPNVISGNNAPVTNSVNKDYTKPNRIPPIVATQVHDWVFLNGKIEQLVVNRFYATHSNGDYKIHTKSPDDYRAIANYLMLQNIDFYTYDLPSEREIKVVIKNINAKISIDHVIADLQKLGYTPESATRFSPAKGKTEAPPFVLVVLKNTPKNKEIFNEKTILSTKVKISAYQRRDAPMICFRCQGHGHSSKRCYRLPRCMKCAETHLTTECTKCFNDGKPPKCANCGLAHVSTFSGCLARPPPRSAKKNVTKANSNLRDGRSYATIAAASRQGVILTPKSTLVNSVSSNPGSKVTHRVSSGTAGTSSGITDENRSKLLYSQSVKQTLPRTSAVKGKRSTKSNSPPSVSPNVTVYNVPSPSPSSSAPPTGFTDGMSDNLNVDPAVGKMLLGMMNVITTIVNKSSVQTTKQALLDFTTELHNVLLC